MADKLVIEGLGKQFDGEYEVDLAQMLVMGNPETMTNGELHTIKRIAGVRAGEIEDALVAGDNDLMLALALIVLARHGKRLPEQLMWDAPAGSGITFIHDESPHDEAELEGDARPPEASPTAIEPTEPSETPETNGGESSNPSPDYPPPSDPPPTGDQPSETPSGVPV